MGIFSRLFGREERAAINIENGEVSGSAPEALLLSALIGDDKINENTALEIPALSAAVDFIADTIAMLPIKLYRENAAEKRAEEVTNDPRVFLLNDETGDLLGAVDAKRAQVRDMLIYGSGYMFINRVGNNVESLHYVKHGDVSVNINSDPIFKAAKFMVGGSNYYPWDFITLTRNTANGVTGRGLVDEHDTILSATYNTLKYENVISRTGGNKKGFLQSDKPLSEPRIRELRDTWNELYANNNNSMMVLNSGIKYTPSASTSVEMQLNQNKLTNAEQIALLLRLSADVLSGKGDTAQYMSSVRTAVLPIIATYTAALNRALLLESEKRDMYFAFDTTELLKGDTLTRYQAYAVGLQNNFLQLDDVRYAEDLPKLGVNYIKLGLQDVLLDPKTGIIYTPNTNAAANMSNMGQLGENGLTDGEDGGIIEERAKSNWTKGAKGWFTGSVSNGSGGRARMTKKEYIRVCSAILTEKPHLKKGTVSGFFYDKHYYIFRVFEPGTYKFDYKIPLRHSRVIDKWRNFYDF